MIKQLLIASGLALTAMSASAAGIEGLYNTGEGFSAGQIDTHYTFASISGTATGTDGFGVVTKNGAYPFPYWQANSEVSSWLAPTANAGQSYDGSKNGVYKWTLTFDLTGYDIESAFFSGKWWADDTGYIQLNGSTISTGAGYRSATSFAASAGFVEGINTLDFYVTNLARATGNPTGIRVEFGESFAEELIVEQPPVIPSPSVPVPEPETYAMLLAGLAMIGAIARRRIG
jgi:hypothetical protein